MANPYLNDDPQPSPVPMPPETWRPSLAMVALLLAVAGLFMPMGEGGWKLPIPVPPFVEPTVDPAKTEGSWVVVVEQTEQRTPEQASLMRDTVFWDGLKVRGLKFRHYDYDSSDAVGYRPLADSVGMPAVAIVGGQGELLGKVLAKFPLSSRDALNAKIKEVTGR